MSTSVAQTSNNNLQLKNDKVVPLNTSTVPLDNSKSDHENQISPTSTAGPPSAASVQREDHEGNRRVAPEPVAASVPDIGNAGIRDSASISSTKSEEANRSRRASKISYSGMTVEDHASRKLFNLMLQTAPQKAEDGTEDVLQTLVSTFPEQFKVEEAQEAGAVAPPNSIIAPSASSVRVAEKV